MILLSATTSKETPMDELLERLEAGDGPSWELDAELALLIGYADCRPPDKNSQHRLPIENQYGHGFYPSDYTSSIDAALTLVPEGGGIDIEIDSSGFTEVGIVMPQDVACAASRTPALAICIAALKAREVGE